MEASKGKINLKRLRNDEFILHIYEDLTVLVLMNISQADYFKNIMQRPSEDVFTKILIIHF